MCLYISIDNNVLFHHCACVEKRCCNLLLQTMGCLVHRMTPISNSSNKTAELGSQRNVDNEVQNNIHMPVGILLDCLRPLSLRSNMHNFSALLQK